MSLWVVRAGRHGEQKETAFTENLVCHAWNGLPDYSHIRTRDEMRVLYERAYPHETEKQICSGLSQVWRFAREIQIGDVVALPLKPESAFAFGRVVSNYEYKVIAPNVIHIRRVHWIKSVPRSVIPKDILDSMNSALTVFKVSRNDAEIRINRLLTSEPPVDNGSMDSEDSEIDDGFDEENIDLGDTARDEILKYIQVKFTGHDLARLVDGVLRAQGYKTETSPPGPDGGVDILAGSGLLGFDPPRLCVQVKSGIATTGQAVLNELLGVVSKFDSEQGLLVSWGGFTKAVRTDARKAFFSIRLWDQGDIVDAVLRNYERLDDEIKAELPLKRIWIMVNDDVE